MSRGVVKVIAQGPTGPAGAGGGGTIPVNEGGTGATTAAGARTNLGVDAAGTAASAVASHAGGTGVHTIAGVTGLQAALDAKEASGTASTAVAAHAGASDPHGDRAYADGQDATHAAAADPHPGYVLESTVGAAGGVAPLDGTGKVASVYLPSFVDDVVEAANFAALPGTGEAGKIYVTLDNGKAWRWGGSAYAEISASPGSTDAVPEGASNLYHTAARVRAAVLTGLSTATNAVIDAADTVLTALGKLQAQITANLATLTGHTGNTSNPHSTTAAQVGAATSGAVTGSGLTMATARLLGRSTASTGAVEEISVGSGLSLSGGTLSASGGGGSPGGSAGQVQYGDGSAFQGSPLWREDANTVALRNGTTAQTFQVFNTHIDASNYERLVATWASNVAELRTQAAGTGTLRNLRIAAPSVFISASSYAQIIGGSSQWFVGYVDNNSPGFTLSDGVALTAGQGSASTGLKRQNRDTDAAPVGLSVTGSNAFASATTNITGGVVTIKGGNGASSSSGAAHGGNVEITPGTGYGTGHAGYVIVSNLPTSASGLPTGALWNDGGTLKIA